jgi:ABC-type Fe3+ transport system permease subunit
VEDAAASEEAQRSVNSSEHTPPVIIDALRWRKWNSLMLWFCLFFMCGGTTLVFFCRVGTSTRYWFQRRCQNWSWVSQGVLGSIFIALPGNPGGRAIQL